MPLPDKEFVAIGFQVFRSLEAWMTKVACGEPTSKKENLPPEAFCSWVNSGGALVLTTIALVVKARRPSGHWTSASTQ